MSEQTVRAAVQDDLPAILELLAEDAIRYAAEPDGITGGATDGQRAALAEIIADSRADVLVGELGGRIVSTAMVNYLRILSSDGALVCQIEAVRTASDVRSRRLGAQLITHIVDQACALGCVRVQLTSNQQRTRARKFYESLGFTASHVGFKLALGEPVR